jgi:hypothetical protein
MLHPDQFRVNEAWIAFQLNDAPIHTRDGGSLNSLALMDAASCFILSSALVSSTAGEASKFEAKRLLKDGYAHKQQMAKVLFIPSELSANNLVLEAERHKLQIVRIPEEQLLIFIGDAKEGFRERFGGVN